MCLVLFANAVTIGFETNWAATDDDDDDGDDDDDDDCQ